MRKDYIGTIDYKSSPAFQHYSKGICKCLKAEQHDISVVEVIKLHERVDMAHENITIAESRDHARRLGNIYGQNRGTGFAGNVWDKNFVSPTITTCQGGGREPHICEVMKVKRVGFIDNGTGQHQSNTVVAPTTTVPYLVELGNPDFYNFLYEIDGELYLIRIRKLIPRECGRLMGVDDESISKMLAINSNTQCYRQFGNSIVVPVLMGIFSQLGLPGIRKWNDMTEEEIRRLINDTTRRGRK